MPNITNFTTNSTLNAKANEIKSKIPNTTNTATAALTAVDDKIPNLVT